MPDSLYTQSGKTGAVLTVDAPVGSTVSITDGSKSYSKTADMFGEAVFKGLATGKWTVTISASGQESRTVEINIKSDYSILIAFFMAQIAVTYPSGSTCTCTKGETVFTAPNTSGSVAFIVPEAGEWVISCTDGTDTASQTVTITADGQSESVALTYSTIPEFTYTGDYEIVDDDDNPITASSDNWKIRFLTSGTLTFSELGNATSGIDVFVVGAGGAGYHAVTGQPGSAGGSGYTNNGFGINVDAGKTYAIVVGGGALSSNSNGASGGNSSAFGVKANGGTGGLVNGTGGSGGSGGTPYGSTAEGGKNGADAVGNEYLAGYGQISKPGPNGETGNTQEFKTGKIYANGGTSSKSTDAPPNSGDGGGAFVVGIRSGSGIVIIRNAREVS